MNRNERETASIPILARFLLLAVAVVVGLFFGLRQVRPPQLDETSVLYSSYQQMMANIERFASEPHPNGSPENEVVKEAILAEIGAMGLTPIVEREEYSKEDIIAQELELTGFTEEEWWEEYKDVVLEEYGGATSFDEAIEVITAERGIPVMQNILVKLDAPDTDRGMLFVSHYDSTSRGPGAADDMVAVAAMLEAMRTYVNNPEIKNDLYFLFTDGEEMGLKGAWKFVRSHMGMEELIDMTVNLEARGNRGALFLFETSEKAYDIMKTTIQAESRPIAFSLASSIYSMMPNNTDFTFFKRASYKGINFAAIEGVENYHMPSDNYENLDRDTAWHYLNTVMSLTNYGASNDLSELQNPSSEAIYFIMPWGLILYNSFVSYLICAVSIGLSLLYVVFLIIHKKLKVSFTIVMIALLVIFSAVSSIYMPSAAYLFYFPLLLIVLVSYLKQWVIAHLVAKVFSRIFIMLLWVPIIFIVWACLVQPLML